MRYITLLLLFFPIAGVAKSMDSNQASAPACSDVMAQIRLAGTYVGPSNFVVQFDKNKEAHLILFLQRPSSSTQHLRWRLIERQGESSTYCVTGQGQGLQLLKDLHLSSPSGKYGMPDSGYPRCAGKQKNGLPGSLDIRLWANRELGKSIVYSLPSQKNSKDFIAMFATQSPGPWIIIASNKNDLDDSCYYDRGDTSSVYQDFHPK